MAALDDIELHLDPIRKALRRGNAAVMVGAGFSFNAENGKKLKDWLELARALYNDLYPGVEMPQRFGISDIMRLGEEYERVRSRAALDEFLLEQIPDEKIAPGPVHKQLLELPWAEIFTTNYDTLLEKAGKEIIEPAHLTVLTREDIPHSRILGRRRIVKLHGSFPSQKPLIFTEEDYRRYPTDFAPFVNMVRQSLLENVFCLIGFSGDDPNFLEWIGWVRDMLSDHSLPIYMFVPEKPAVGLERVLLSRRIQPVVLPVVSDDASKNTFSNRYAKLFELLGKGLGENRILWPSDEIQRVAPQHYEDSRAKYQAFLEWAPRLQKERKAYPGWLIAPDNERGDAERLIHTHDDAERMLGALEKMPIHAVVVFEEFAWWHRILLWPMVDTVAATVERVLDATIGIPKGSQPLERDDVLKSLHIYDAADFRRTWIRLAIAFLRWIREQAKSSQFETWFARIKEISHDDPAVLDEITHEQILLSVYLGDRERAEQLLTGWFPQVDEPYMAVRKGVLLAEVGLIEQGETICVAALQRIREMVRLDSENLGLLSREAWASLVTHHITRATAFSWVPIQSRRSSTEAELDKRLNQLAQKNIAPRRDISSLEAKLNIEAPLTASRHYVTREFDLGTQSRHMRLGGPKELRQKLESAFAWLALVDDAAYVPRVGLSTWDIDTLKQAAWWIRPFENAERVWGVLIRTMDTDIFKPVADGEPVYSRGWFSRYQVGSMDLEAAREHCRQSITAVMRSYSARTRKRWDDRVISFRLQLYSRLVLRETDEKLLYEYVEYMVLLYKGSGMRRDVNQWEDFGDAFRRTFEALSDKQMLEVIPKLLSLPDMDDYQLRDPRHSRWPDWGFSQKEPTKNQAASPDLVRSVTTAVGRWLDALDAIRKGPDLAIVEDQARRLWARMYWCKNHALLNDEATRRIGEYIWRGNPDWPDIPGLRQLGILDWPSPGNEDIASAYKRALLRRDVPNFHVPAGFHADGKPRFMTNSYVDDVFAEEVADTRGKVRWNTEEINEAIAKIRAWWDREWDICRGQILKDTSGPRRYAVYGHARRRLLHFDQMLAQFYRDTDRGGGWLDAETSIWVSQLIERAAEVGIFLWNFRVQQSLAENTSLPSFVEELSTTIMGNDDGDIRDVTKLVMALAKDERFDGVAPPRGLIEAMAAIIATRRFPGLVDTLNAMVAIVQFKWKWLSQREIDLLITGLQSLFGELKYGVPTWELVTSEDDVPVLRYLCIHMALYLRVRGIEHAVVQQWIEGKGEDPMPEVRFMLP
ncbi:MAG TPA: SIR2 family protein [Acidimicrobiales bacterium]|nr:SIR2 family protein [Acidimicrobiales bacterium]